MKDKLVYVLPSFDKNSSTHFVHTLELIEELGKHMDVFLFIEQSNGSPKLKNVSGIYLQKYRFPLFSFLERILVFMKLRAKGYRKLYVHYSYWSAILGGLVFKLTFGKLYYWHCELYRDYGQDKSFWDLKWKLFDDLPLKFCLKWCTHLVTGTKAVADFYSKRFNLRRKKILIMPNSINLDRFKYKKNGKKKKNQIVFVHWLAPRKGADLLPEIVSLTNKDLKFKIIGGGPLEKSLKKSFKGNKRVELTGEMANDKVRKVIAESELLIMPSRQEGFPRIIIEAMALGTAFVSTDVGGLKDIVTKENNLIPVEDNKSFAAEILKLVSKPKKRQALMESGFKRAKDYSHVIVAENFAILLNK